MRSLVSQIFGLRKLYVSSKALPSSSSCRDVRDPLPSRPPETVIKLEYSCDPPLPKPNEGVPRNDVAEVTPTGQLGLRR
eukprot:scaffold2102_cov161-Amphora_coffeaeformis.AAC.2